jgi:hypothetical protein
MEDSMDLHQDTKVLETAIPKTQRQFPPKNKKNKSLAACRFSYLQNCILKLWIIHHVYKLCTCSSLDHDVLASPVEDQHPKLRIINIPS